MMPKNIRVISCLPRESSRHWRHHSASHWGCHRLSRGQGLHQRMLMKLLLRHQPPILTSCRQLSLERRQAAMESTSPFLLCSWLSIFFSVACISKTMFQCFHLAGRHLNEALSPPFRVVCPLWVTQVNPQKHQLLLNRSKGPH